VPIVIDSTCCTVSRSRPSLPARSAYFGNGGIYSEGNNWGNHGWNSVYRHSYRYGRFHRSNYYAGGSCYKTVPNEFGLRRINVCETF
jgi:hypothetical protein